MTFVLLSPAWPPGAILRPEGGPPVAGARTLRFLEALGRGGFGAVYLAELHGADDFVQRVAVKLLHSDAAPDSELAARQRDEARLLALLNHDAIVKVTDLLRVDGRPAVVMEVVEGVDCAQLLRDGPLPARAAAQVVAQAASALDAAWSSPSPRTGAPLRVIHRDVKPANLLVSRHGGVKVLDFGIARAEFDREGATRSVQYGTARYMAPEQWLQGNIGHGVDVYALGVTACELLGGAALARAPLSPAAFAAHVDAAVRAAVGAAWPEAVALRMERLLRGMLAMGPHERPSAAHVADEALALSELLPGPSLGRWAPERVPALLEARRARLAGEALPPDLRLDGGSATSAPTAAAPRAPAAAGPGPAHQGVGPAAADTGPLRALVVSPAAETTPLPAGASAPGGAAAVGTAPAPPQPGFRWRGLVAAALFAAVASGGVLWGVGQPSPPSPAPGPLTPAAVAPGGPAPRPAAAPAAAPPAAALPPAAPVAARPAPPREAPAAVPPAPAAPTPAPAPPPTALAAPAPAPAADPAPAPAPAPAAAAAAAPLSAAPAPAAVEVAFKSDPPGALVRVYDKRTGDVVLPDVQAPAFHRLPPGPYVVRMAMGEAVQTAQITVHPDKARTWLWSPAPGGEILTHSR